jgi:hypothetical protein
MVVESTFLDPRGWGARLVSFLPAPSNQFSAKYVVIKDNGARREKVTVDGVGSMPLARAARELVHRFDEWRREQIGIVGGYTRSKSRPLILEIRKPR